MKKQCYKTPEAREIEFLCEVGILSESNRNHIESGKEDDNEFEF